MNYEDLFCERFFQLILPNFYNKVIRNENFNSLYDYLSNSCKQPNGSIFEDGEEFRLDLLGHFNKCIAVESNLLYFLWIINFFQPLISTLFTILFILPLLLCLTIYLSSIYLLLTKHWKLFKVSACDLFFLFISLFNIKAFKKNISALCNLLI